MNEIFQDEPRILSRAEKLNSFLYDIARKFSFTKLEYGLKTLGIAKYSDDCFLRLKALRRLANLEDLDGEKKCQSKIPKNLKNINQKFIKINFSLF